MKKILSLLIILFMLSCMFYSTPPLGEINFPLKQDLTIAVDEDIQQIAVNDTWVVACTLNNLIAIDINTQKEIWKINFRIKNEENACTFVSDIFVAASYDQIIVINKLGEKKEINLVSNKENIHRVVGVYSNYLYIIRVPSWQLEVYDIFNNILLWEIYVGRGNTNVFFSTSDNIVYIATTLDSVSAYDNYSGNLLWSQGGHTIITSAFEKDILYFYEEISDKDHYRVSALDVRTQSILWETDYFFSPSSGINKLTIINNLLIASAGDLIAMDKSSGEEKWRSQVGESFFTSPIEFNDVIYAKVYASRTVFAISPSDGNVIGTSNLDIEDDSPIRFTDVTTGVYKIKDGIIFNGIKKIVIYKIQ